MSERYIKHFQQTVVKLLQEIESKKEEYQELQIKFDFVDKEFTDLLIKMSSLKLDIVDLERKFENLFME